MNTPENSIPDFIWPSGNNLDFSETGAGISDHSAEDGYWNKLLSQERTEDEENDQRVTGSLLNLFTAPESSQGQTPLKRKQRERAKEAVRRAKDILQKARRDLLASIPLRERRLPISFFIIPGTKNVKGNANFAELPQTARGQSAPQAAKPPQRRLPPVEDMDYNVLPVDGGPLEANDINDPMLAMLANDIENDT